MNVFVLLICVAIGIFLLRAIRNIFYLAGAPPRVRLVSIEATGSHARDLEAHTPQLEKCGFGRIGTYRVDPMRRVFATAYTHPHESVCAIVYSHPIDGCFIDMVSRSETGRSFTASTAPVEAVPDRREGHEKVFNPSLAVPALLDLVLRRRPQEPWETWTAGNFAERFEDAYEQEMDWRTRRGVVVRDDGRRAAYGKPREFSESDIQAATRELQEEFAESRRDPS